MDTVKLTSFRDFALSTGALAFMQSAYGALEKIGYLGGDNFIISGCTVSGSTATSGWMFLKGQLMPFQGGSIQDTVKIVETTQTVNVDVASRQQNTYQAEFGSSIDSSKNVAWADIKRPAKITDIFSKTETDDRYLRFRGYLGDTKDLNTLNTIADKGLYEQENNAGAAGGTNYPVNLAGSLEVVPAGAGVIQKYTTYRTSGVGPRMFFRAYYDYYIENDPEIDPWSDWLEIETKSYDKVDLNLINGFILSSWDSNSYAQIIRQGHLRILQFKGLKVSGGSTSVFAQLSEKDIPDKDILFAAVQSGGVGGPYFGGGQSNPNTLPPQILGGVLASGDVVISHVNQDYPYSGTITWSV